MLRRRDELVEPACQSQLDHGKVRRLTDRRGTLFDGDGTYA
jgi:hypothetical protein